MRARVAVLGLLLLSACLWRSYEQIMTVHLDVLTSMVDKVVDTAESGRRPTSNDVTELTYPLQRARQFAGQYERYKDRRSFQAFGALLERYARFVDAIDTARGDAGRWAALAPGLPAEGTALREVRRSVDAALAEER